MHAYTIAVTLAMAGSSMAAVLQNPPSTSTITTTVDEIRPYGPTCAGIGPDGHGGPTCAGVGPDAHTPSPPAAQKEEEEDSFVPYTGEDIDDMGEIGYHLDSDHDGDFDHHDMENLRNMSNELEEPEHDEPEPKEPEHVKPALPKLFEPPTVRVATKASPACPKCNKCNKCSKCTECPKCPKCPDPGEHNPNWNRMVLLNDTRKNVNGFKLFAELKAPPSEAFPPRFAVHVREHQDRKDIWNVKMFPEVEDEMNEEIQKLKETATPQQKAVLDELKSFNSYQPRWNLADNRLETRSNNSAPVNDALYFRLFEDQRDSKDTSQYHGSAYRSMLTTNSNKGSYNKEHNAKLIGKKSWQLKRDSDAPWHYTLINKDMPGNFFWCLDHGKMSAVEEKVKNMMESSEQEDVESGVVEVLQALGDHEGAELMYMTSNETAVQLTTGKINCRAVTLKVR
jgi:hypothetical protein